MKLISINVEGSAHLDRVRAFIEKEQPDVLCLQEAQPDLQIYLESLSYTVAFLPMTIRVEGSTHEREEEGIMIATRHGGSFDGFYYYSPDAQLHEFKKTEWRHTCAHGVLYAEISHEEKTYVIATSHFTWTPNGSIPNQEQKDDMDSFTKQVKALPPHIMCGDFNIPRKHNSLYAELTSLYTDEVPLHYASSLDKNLHRCGKDENLSIMFEEYMVDYIFTQLPYVASDVRLEFGISDHAAVVATITRQ